jgi:hypothetical protein
VGQKRLNIKMEKALNSDNIDRTTSLLKRTIGNSKKRTKTDEAMTDTMVGDHSSKSLYQVSMADS